MSKKPSTASRERTDQDWQTCLEEAIGFYESHIDETIDNHIGDCDHPKCPKGDCSRPTTALEYFNETRGWHADTIDSARLGYAPPNDKIVSYLTDKGFSPDTLRSTGLFKENTSPRWQGRYVFPFLTPDGKPVSAISRSTGDPWKGRHPADKIPGKYAVVAHTKEHSEVEQSVYGLHSLEQGKPVILAEGIPDALSVQNEGYPCVAQAGTTLKEDLIVQLTTHLRKLEVPHITVVPDAERPSIIDEGGEGTWPLVNQQTQGVTGSLQTATSLSEKGFSVQFATLPRHGLDKVDLDDYVQDKWGSLQTLIHGARPVKEHPAFGRWSERISDSTNDAEPSTQSGDSTGDESGLYDLDLTTVLGEKEGYRGKNPLGHIGNRSDYFVVTDDDRAYDHKRGVTYNARTYLLCEAGERRPSRPEGRLSDRELFEAWKRAKKDGHLSSDDPIPSRALAYIAREHELCASEDIDDGWKLPLGVYSEALTLVREEYDLNPGRNLSSDPEPYRSLSPTPERSGVDILNSSSGPSERQSDSGDFEASDDEHTSVNDAVTLSSARAACHQALVQAIEEGQTVLIDALPAMGKSSGVARAVKRTGQPVTLLTARHELYDQHVEWCAERNLRYYQLPAFHRDCPTAAGEHGDDWAERVIDLYDRGVQAGTIHRHARAHFGELLPCTKGGGCPYQQRWEFVPDDYDVLIGHYTHAYKQEVVEDRRIVFDESPVDQFVHKIAGDEVTRAVSNYLHRHSDSPFDDFTSIIEQRADEDLRRSALEWCRKKGVGRDSQAVLQADTDDALALAPLLLFALLQAENLGNGWERAVVDDVADSMAGVVVARERTSGDISLLQPPDLDQSSGVIGLEGLATPELWRLGSDQPLEYTPVLDTEDRRDYLRHGLGLEIIQTETEAVKPYSGGSVNVDKDKVLIEAVCDREDVRPALISTRKALRIYEDAGLLVNVQGTEHYGNLTGSNQFEGKKVGIVSGSRHYGDGYVKQWGAFKGVSVERRGDGKGLDLDYGSFGNKVLQHMREHQTLQAVLRFARGDTDSRVYVHTAALPNWVPLAATGSVTTWSQGTKRVLSTLRSEEQGAWTTEQVAEGIELSTRQTRNVLKKLQETGLVQCQREGRGYRWTLREEDATTGTTDEGWIKIRR